MSKQRLDYSLTVILKGRVPTMDRKLKVTYNIFLSLNFCEKSITLTIRMSVFCNIVSRGSEEPDVKNKTKKSGFALNKVQFKEDFTYFMWKGRRNIDI